MLFQVLVHLMTKTVTTTLISHTTNCCLNLNSNPNMSGNDDLIKMDYDDENAMVVIVNMASQAQCVID